MDRFVLKRSGKLPLRFEGVELARVEGEFLGGVEQTRWHDLALHRTRAGQYVVAVAYRSRWGEPERDDAYHAATAAEVATVLAAHDPLAPVVGYPSGAAHEEKNQRLRSSIFSRWEYQISELFSQVDGAEFAEAIE